MRGRERALDGGACAQRARTTTPNPPPPTINKNPPPPTPPTCTPSPPPPPSLPPTTPPSSSPSVHATGGGSVDGRVSFARTRLTSNRIGPFGERSDGDTHRCFPTTAVRLLLSLFHSLQSLCDFGVVVFGVRTVVIRAYKRKPVKCTARKRSRGLMHTIITYYRRRRRHRNAGRVMWVTPGVLFWFQNRSCLLTHTAAAATAV